MGPDVLPGTAGRMPGPCLSFLELRVAHGAGMGQDVADVGDAGEVHDHALEAQAEPGVLAAAVAPQIQVKVSTRRTSMRTEA